MNSSLPSSLITRRLQIGLIFLLFLLGSVATQAQTTNWTGATNSNWNTPGNWDNGVPTPTLNAVISSTATNQPILSTTATAKSVEVRTGASLSINSAGSLTINGSKLVSGNTIALFNSGTVNNSGQVTIGNLLTADVGKYGIFNQGTFTNGTGGSIQIDRSTETGLYNEAGSFTNSATVTIGTSATIGKDGLFNRAIFTNNSPGLIQIDRSFSAGISNLFSATFTNSASLVIGSLASVGTWGLLNQATFTNNTGGEIKIDNATSIGLYNESGTFTNAAKITIGATASAGMAQNGLTNNATFNNNTGGQITIDRVTFRGIQNNNPFSNAGEIRIGATAITAQDCIRNTQSFINHSSGKIYLDRSWGNGIWHSGNSFQNSGEITIGSIAYTGLAGILNRMPFSNYAGGSIQLNQVNRGLTNESTFDNAGQIRMGNNGALGERGLLNSTVSAVFNNLTGSLLQIDQTAAGQDGITNEVRTTFNNAGTVSIGTSGSIGGDGVENAGTISNSACAVLTVFDNINNSGGFTNAGLFTVSTTQPHTNSGTLVNNGIISYPQGNPIPNVTNNGVIAAPLQICYEMPYTPALQLGGGNFNVGPTWYTNPSLTTVAGAYTPPNTFTPNNLNAVNTYPLSFTVGDNANGCVRTATLSATVSFPVSITAQPAASSVVCEFGSVSVPVGVTGTVLGYQWYKNGTAVPGQTSATLSLPSAQPSDTGTYSLVVTGGCNSSTSTAFSLSVSAAPVVTLIFGNSATVMGTGIPTITIPPSTNQQFFQATGGNLYERSVVIDRINGYEIRQTDSNTTGIFTINRLGLFTLTVTGAGGCQRTVQWVVQ